MTGPDNTPLAPAEPAIMPKLKTVAAARLNLGFDPDRGRHNAERVRWEDSIRMTALSMVGSPFVVEHLRQVPAWKAVVQHYVRQATMSSFMPPETEAELDGVAEAAEQSLLSMCRSACTLDEQGHWLVSIDYLVQLFEMMLAVDTELGLGKDQGSPATELLRRRGLLDEF